MVRAAISYVVADVSIPNLVSMVRKGLFCRWILKHGLSVYVLVHRHSEPGIALQREM